MFLANDGNYREGRWFTSWKKINYEDHILPKELQEVTHQLLVPFGEALLRLGDTVIGVESCEELWTSNSPHIMQCLAGAEIIGNGSGSHHQLRKLDARLDLMRSATAKSGGLYLYSNQRGCDGSRLYFDGTSTIFFNGDLLAQASQFSLRDVEVVTAVVDLQDIRSFRSSIASRQVQAADDRTVSASYPIIDVTYFHLSPGLEEEESSGLWTPSQAITPRIHSPEEECAMGPACWLWDYLRRSGAGGYFIPLSGGADSASVTAIVAVMCDLVIGEIQSGNLQVQTDVQRLVDGKSCPFPSTPHELMNLVLHTVYMGSSNSSAITSSRAAALARSLGAYHTSLSIDSVFQAIVSLFGLVTGHTPRYLSLGGSLGEDLALQNIQARVRMVLSYLFACLLPWTRGHIHPTTKRSSFLLVLATGNVDEALRGYMTKYDCSSADLNPIGSICKTDLRRMLQWAAERFGVDMLAEIAGAPPTAELRPLDRKDPEGGDDAGASASADSDSASADMEHTQTDEDDMGMTYDELGVYGSLRKVWRCGPVSMFQKLVYKWAHLHLPSHHIAEKVKHFFRCYGVNRHKMTTITPSYHAESYSPDDNRFDLRQFLYPYGWTRQFGTIDELVAKGNGRRVKG